MPSPFWTILKEWQTFYVIIGGAAATLIGLMFVATSLASDHIIEQQAADNTRIYVSPTIIYFTSALVTAASMTIPAITQPVIGALTLLLGACGLLFCLFVLKLTRRMMVSDWNWGDWAFHVIAPLLSYAILSVVGVLLLAGQTEGIDILPLAMVLLLVSGIRNSWDLALWLASHR